MRDRTDKILDVAIELAEKGGFENVRQRDVAAAAGVALGTLYKRFRSKEDILCAALDREAEELERRMEKNPVKGDEPVERVMNLFLLMTRGLCRKPNYARAVIRAMASGVPEIAGKVAAYYGRISGLEIAAMRGVGRLSFSDARTSPPTAEESRLALFMQQLWFANLVGWSAGLFGQNEITDHLREAAEILFSAQERAR
jgi:AcrR family transcriptional regulator